LSRAWCQRGADLTIKFISFLPAAAIVPNAGERAVLILILTLIGLDRPTPL